MNEKRVMICKPLKMSFAMHFYPFLVASAGVRGGKRPDGFIKECRLTVSVAFAGIVAGCVNRQGTSGLSSLTGRG